MKPGDKIVILGDSITAAGGYVRDIDALLAKQYPELKIPTLINKGIGGQKAKDLLARFQRDVIDLKPAFVTIHIGINDVWHRVNAPHDPKVLAAYKANVAKMVDMAQQAGIRVILLTPTIIEEKAGSEGNRRLTMYVEAEKQVAAAKKCQLVDLHAMFLTALAKHPKNLTADGVHMKPLGDAIMATGILPRWAFPTPRSPAAEPLVVVSGQWSVVSEEETAVSP